MSDTVRVRLAVGWGEECGTMVWNAYGSQHDDDKSRVEMLDNWDHGDHIVFVEADIPLPKAQTVEGGVK